MVELPELSRVHVDDRANEQTIERGVQIYDAAQVGSVIWRGGLLIAEVEGSSDEPYDVMVRIDEFGITSAECSCPYTYGGDCKHIVATLLHYIDKRDKIEQRPAIEDLVLDLAPEQLKLLVLHLVSRRPAMMNSAERFINHTLN